MNQNLKNVVGLFGTCGDSTWRKPVMTALAEAGIEFFNPVVPEWNDACAAIEAEHLSSDQVILMVITGETEGVASLAETGWAALAAASRGQTFILVVQDFDPTGATEKDVKNQARARKLIRKHATTAGIKVCGTVEEAVTATIEAMRS